MSKQISCVHILFLKTYKLRLNFEQRCSTVLKRNTKTYRQIVIFLADSNIFPSLMYWPSLSNQMHIKAYRKKDHLVTLYGDITSRKQITYIKINVGILQRRPFTCIDHRYDSGTHSFRMMRSTINLNNGKEFIIWSESKFTRWIAIYLQKNTFYS